VRSPAGDGGNLTPLVQDRPYDGTTRAYVCENFACRTPVDNPDDLMAVLDELL
jgi:uncharacterized protein YyaL (SSP411 family)